MNQACNESTVTSLGHCENATGRQRFLNATTFILRALPADLTRDELLSLQAAGPTCMLRAVQHPNTSTQVRTGLPKQNSSRNLTPFQRIVATMIIQSLIVLQFLLPYIKLFVSRVYMWECEHKLVRQIIKSTMRGCKRAVTIIRGISRRVSHLTRGRIEQALKGATVWCVEGLVVGIQQGILEGVDMFEGQDAL